MAMEHACVLAEEVTLKSALASFVKRRKPRVEWVQQQSMARSANAGFAAGSRAMAPRESADRATRARFTPFAAAR